MIDWEEKEPNFLEASLESACCADVTGAINNPAGPWNNLCHRCIKGKREPGQTANSEALCTCPDDPLHPEPKPKVSFTKHQWVVLIVCILANFGCAVCVSLQAPFFPLEAEKKGFGSTVYGLVFGAFSLTVFIMAPVFGTYMAVLGTQFVLNTGIFITSTCCILFGLLDKAAPSPFIGLSFAIRIVEAMGEAAYSTACFSMIAQEFPNNVGTTFAAIRAAFGAGLIGGPTIGGVLYQVGGYYLPFAVMGGTLFIIAIATKLIFCGQSDVQQTISKKPKLFKALKIPSVFLSCVNTCSAAMSVGFLAVSLGPHLNKQGLNSVHVGLMFAISGGTFAFTSVGWGWLCDGRVKPKLLTTVGFAFVCVCYLLLGPPPFMPFKTHLYLCVIALVAHGLGMGGVLLPPYVDALKESVRHGFPDDLDTYAMIGGLWSGTTQLGNFIGPTVGGVLIDYLEFRWATVVLLGYQATMGVITFIFYVVMRRQDKLARQEIVENIISHVDEEYKPLLVN